MEFIRKARTALPYNIIIILELQKCTSSVYFQAQKAKIFNKSDFIVCHKCTGYF